ncbi:MAG: biotin-dependent carboxyltransferase family protein [Isosphaeraceae bacterium]
MGLLVIDAGLSTTVQDLGRPGYRQWGVPPGGPFDRGSAGIANALVGNSPDCAVLELTLRGGVYQADCPLAIALAGAPIEAQIIGSDSRERRIELPLSCSLAAGERLVLGRTRDGARAYLAVKGGWQTSPILGSRSSEVRIAGGTVLPAGPGAIPTRHICQTTWKSPSAEPFRIIPGPDEGTGSSFDHHVWIRRNFRVSSHADRVGVRLEGEPLNVFSPPERLSTPVAPGAIQLAGGQLIILGVACGTMGGYPHIAHVISADLDRIGQLKPGDTLHFLPATLDEARRLDRVSRTQNKFLTDRLNLLARDEEIY